MVLGFWDLDVPIVGAPMAGGPGTPALAAAVSNAGGLGFLAGGYISPDRLAYDIAAARAATTGPIGVNLFVPQPSVADMHQLDFYAEALDELAEHYDVEIGYPNFGDDDGWQQKLEVLADLRPELVSFTFGAPSPDVLRWFGALGMLLFVTVTSTYEAGVALAAGADGLVVQGPDAGGHRGTFAPDMSPGTESLTELLHRIGTALLLSDEAGTNAAHRSALGHPQFDTTVVTRAFSGRYARGLANDFTRMLDHVAPLGYPEVNQMTSPIRRAAVELEDPHGTNLWAGTAYRQAQTGAAKDIVTKLGHV